MKNKFLISLTLLLSGLTLSAQFSKSELRKIKRLKKRNDFVSVDNRYFNKPKNCNTIFTGDFSKGPSDGGGAYNNGIVNLKKVDLKGKELEKITDFHITLPFSRNHRKYNHLIRIKSYSTGKVGFMDTCGKVILPPTYDHINGFNKDGLAVCFQGNSIQVIDATGKEILAQNKPYPVDYRSFWTIPSPGKINELKVLGDNILIHEKEGYAIYNIKEDKIITKKHYSEINEDPITHKNDSYLIGKRKDKETLIDLKTGKELIPPCFYKIKRIASKNGETLVYGSGKNYKNYNIFNVEQMEFILPLDLKSTSAEALKDFPNIWVLYDISNSGHGLYDNNTKKALIPVNENIGHISKYPINNTVKVSYRNTSDDTAKLYDLKNKRLMDIKIGNKYDAKKITLEKDGKQVTFLNYSFQPNPRDTSSMYNIIYDQNWNPIVENVRVRGVKTRGDIFYFYEYVNGQKKYTAFDIHGKIIGERGTFTP